MIVLDTSVLSLAFRRRSTTAPESPAAKELRRLIEQDVPLFVPGIVAQELLSGVRAEAQFRKLRELLSGFPLLLAEERHHLRGARISNECRRAGRSFSTIDCLIAAHALELPGPLLTADVDFRGMAPLCGLKLHRIP